MDSFYQGVIKGMGLDIDFSEAERKNAKRNKMKSAKDRWFYDYADEKGNLPGITEIKMFAKHGHPNKQVESAAKNFQKTFGKTKMDDWKFGGFYGKSTLLPKDPKLHKQYEDALSKFFKKWEKTGYGNPYKQKSQTFNDWFY